MLVFSLSCSLIQLKNLHWITETACMINSPSFVLKKVQRYVGPWSKQNSYQISVQLNAKSSWFSFLYSNLPGFWPCDAFWFPVQHLLKLWNRDGSRAHPFCQVMVETQHLKQDKSKLNTRNTNTVTFKDNWNKQKYQLIRWNLNVKKVTCCIVDCFWWSFKGCYLSMWHSYFAQWGTWSRSCDHDDHVICPWFYDIWFYLVTKIVPFGFFRFFFHLVVDYSGTSIKGQCFCFYVTRLHVLKANVFVLCHPATCIKGQCVFFYVTCKCFVK